MQPLHLLGRIKNPLLRRDARLDPQPLVVRASRAVGDQDSWRDETVEEAGHGTSLRSKARAPDDMTWPQEMGACSPTPAIGSRGQRPIGAADERQLAAWVVMVVSERLDRGRPEFACAHLSGGRCRGASSSAKASGAELQRAWRRERIKIALKTLARPGGGGAASGAAV
jgi:hypothetical protein